MVCYSYLFKNFPQFVVIHTVKSFGVVSPTDAAAAAATAAKSLQSCLTLCDPIDSSPPGSPSLGFSRQEHWSGLPLLSPVYPTRGL